MNPISFTSNQFSSFVTSFTRPLDTMQKKVLTVALFAFTCLVATYLMYRLCTFSKKKNVSQQTSFPQTQMLEDVAKKTQISVEPSLILSPLPAHDQNSAVSHLEVSPIFEKSILPFQSQKPPVSNPEKSSDSEKLPEDKIYGHAPTQESVSHLEVSPIFEKPAVTSPLVPSQSQKPPVSTPKKSSDSEKLPQYKIYGQTQVEDLKTKELIDVRIEKSPNDYGYRILRICTNNGIELGSVKYAKMADKFYYAKHRNTHVYGCEDFEGDFMLALYGIKKQDLERKVPKIYVEKLISLYNKDYRGVGTRLMQAVFEVSLHDKNGSGGRIQLQAVDNSHAFYYKACHMRAMQSHYVEPESSDSESSDSENDKNRLSEQRKGRTLRPHEVDAVIHAKAEKGKDEKDFGYIYMYLPKDSIEKWTQKVKENPVLQKSRQSK